MFNRKITISVDPATGTMVAVGENVSVSQYHDYTREEDYEQQLFNGQVSVVAPNGTVTDYPDGCHLVRQSGKFVHAMDKPAYEEWTGRPGSGNEA